MISRRGAFHDGVVEGFFVEDDVRLDDAAVFRTARCRCALDEVEIVESAAGHAVVAHDGAVKLVDFFAAGELVQAVDVLSDDGGEVFPRVPSLASFRCTALGPSFGAIILVR